MTILTFPTAVRAPQIVQWGLEANTQTHESPFDKTVQTIAMPGARWYGTIAWSKLPLAQWRILSAFIAQLGGRAGRFTFSPPQAWRRATADIFTTPRINGAGQSGSSLVSDGWVADALVLMAGDWISWPDAAGRPQLHQITADVTANGSAQATLPIAPPIRSPGADDALIEIYQAQGVFMLADDKQGQAVHNGEDPTKASISIDIVEALV